MKSLIKVILTSLMLIGWVFANGQVRFGIELLPDQSTYVVSLESDTTILPPFNITSSVQITMRVPHGEGANSFVVGNLTNLQPNTSWDDNVYLYSPDEAPAWDYISFALISMGTTGLTFTEGVKTPLFSFTNEADACVGEIELIDNETDPFLPPNSMNANIGHSMVVFGMGLTNAYIGNLDEWIAPCVPEPNCVDDPVEQNTAICIGEDFDGYFFEEDTTLVRHYFSIDNCDSTVITHLQVHPTYELETDVSVCLGEEHNGQVYFTNSTYVQYLLTTEGCDSIVTTNIEVLQPAFTNTEETVCFGDEFANTIIENDTLVYQIFTATNGCDSIVNTQVYVNNFEIIQKDTTICAGETINGTVFVIDTLIEEILLGFNGCDSLVSQTQVNIIPPSQTTSEVLLVEGDSYQNFYPTADTTIIQNLIGQTGCDSIATTNITVFPPNTIIVDTLICQGQMIQGQIIEADTILTETTANGLIVTNVEVLPATMSLTSQMICYGQIYNGIAWYSDTTLTQVFNGSSSCDSVALTFLSVQSSIETEIFTPICLGQDFNGVVYESDTILMSSHTSYFGCDSLVTNNLQIIQPSSYMIEEEICKGELYKNEVFESDTIFIETYTGSNGCDSIVQTLLTVHALPEPEIIGQNTFCNGESIELTTQYFDNYQWNNNSTQPSIQVTESGMYYLTVTDENGCTNNAEFLTTASTINAEIELTEPSCKDNGTIEFVQISGGLPPYTYSVDGGNAMMSEAIFPNLLPDEYELVIEDADGCQWLSETYLSEATELKIEVEKEQVLSLGETVRMPVYINLLTYDSIIWTPSKGLSCSDCEVPIAKPLETTNYRVKVMANGGCVAEESVLLTVEKPEKLFLPNVFSPNNDGENDMFYPLAKGDVQQIKSFKIFDRYGGIVFEQKDFMPNNPSFGWDGKKKGQPLNSGVYIWMTEVEFIDGQIEVKQGEVTLLK